MKYNKKMWITLLFLAASSNMRSSMLKKMTCLLSAASVASILSTQESQSTARSIASVSVRHKFHYDTSLWRYSSFAPRKEDLSKNGMVQPADNNSSCHTQLRAIIDKRGFGPHKDLGILNYNLPLYVSLKRHFRHFWQPKKQVYEIDTSLQGMSSGLLAVEADENDILTTGFAPHTTFEGLTTEPGREGVTSQLTIHNGVPRTGTSAFGFQKQPSLTYSLIQESQGNLIEIFSHTIRPVKSKDELILQANITELWKSNKNHKPSYSGEKLTVDIAYPTPSKCEKDFITHYGDGEYDYGFDAYMKRCTTTPLRNFISPKATIVDH